MENPDYSESLEKPAKALAVTCADIADVHYLAAVGSTNTWLKERHAAGNIRRPVLVLADSQTAGRGTRGREWLQAGQDLALSCGASVGLDVEIDQRLSLAVGALVAESIETVTGLPARVKWPNDVLTRRLRGGEQESWLKVSGSLIETTVGAGQKLLIVGIGVNVNSTAVHFPSELAHRVITLRDALDAAVERSTLAMHLSTSLLELMAQIFVPATDASAASSRIERLVADWFERDVTAGTRYVLHRDSTSIPVIACHIDRDTCGLVCTDDRQREYLVTAYTELTPAQIH